MTSGDLKILNCDDLLKVKFKLIRWIFCLIIIYQFIYH